jgi:excisionase family DNA binding protein
MTDPSTVLAECLVAIIKPIVRDAVREALNSSRERDRNSADNRKTFLTVKQAVEMSGLGASTIRLAIRRRRLRAQKVGRRVLIKRTDLEDFCEVNPIEKISD